MNPVNNVINNLNNQVKVLWKNEYTAKYNELFDVFYSFCLVNGKYISLHGEMHIETFYKRRIIESKVAKLYRCEYEITDKGLVQTSKKYVGLGADPRMVSDEKNAYGYVIGYGEAKHPAFLYVENDNSLHPIKAADDFDWGKNWQPFLKEERLYIVHELTPYRVYEIDLNTYKLTLVNQVNSIYNLPAHYTNHSMFRGGANAITEENFVYGLGRASAQPYKHTPFFWSSSNNEAPIFLFTDFFNQLSDKGFNILDPTCFFKLNDNQYCIGLVCSETTWFHGQKFMNLLLIVDEKNKFKKLPLLKDVLSIYSNVLVNNKPNLENYIFHCDRMQRDIPFTYEYGVQSTGKRGGLVYGPYVELTEKMKLAVELSYLTVQEKGTKAGIFDINLSKELENGEIERVLVTDCYLKATDKEISTITLYFDTSKFIGYKAEFRVIASRGYKLNAFHIRTTKIDELPPLKPLIKRRGDVLRKWFHLFRDLVKK